MTTEGPDGKKIIIVIRNPTFPERNPNFRHPVQELMPHCDALGGSK